MPVFLLVASGNIVAYVHGADGKQMKEVNNPYEWIIEVTNNQIIFIKVLKYQVETEINIAKSEGNLTRKSISLEDTLPAKVNIEDENEQ